MGTARLTFSLAGPADGDLAVEGRLAAESIIADAQGTARFPGEKPGVLAFKRLAGTLAGRRIDGQLTARFETPLRLDGRFAFDTIDVPAAIAAAAGMPAPADGGTIWTKEPFRRSLADLAGQITFSAPAASFAPDLPGRDLRGVCPVRSDADHLREGHRAGCRRPGLGPARTGGRSGRTDRAAEHAPVRRRCGGGARARKAPPRRSAAACRSRLRWRGRGSAPPPSSARCPARARPRWRTAGSAASIRRRSMRS